MDHNTSTNASDSVWHVIIHRWFHLWLYDPYGHYLRISSLGSTLWGYKTRENVARLTKYQGKREGKDGKYRRNTYNRQSKNTYPFSHNSTENSDAS